ncbi:MAG: DedA family protein [Deltaproteobacteria bacterium]|jgi:membrane-associated protein|nr:DedA family protein [Deltaproteobacteria bacterium]
MEALDFLIQGIGSLINFILHIDVHLDNLVAQYGWRVYLILFAIVFWETGVVVCPFLPGDSLLFAAGAIAARDGSPLSPGALLAVIILAAFLGDTFNYWIGRIIGPKALNRDGRFLKRKYLDKTRDFYEKYGASTIIIARFVPIVRTFAPFVAGVGAMRYPRFLTFNVVGGAAWALIFITAGYFFGGLAMVRKNFTMVIMAIIVLSVLPMVVEYVKARRRGAAERKAQADEAAPTGRDAQNSLKAPENAAGPVGPAD